MPTPARTEHQVHLTRITHLADLLDNRFSILGIRFGWDAILGVIPGVGDVITSIIACYLVLVALQTGASWSLLLRMSVNIVVDFFVSEIPLIGDIGDVWLRANRRNARLLKEHLEEKGARGRE